MTTEKENEKVDSEVQHKYKQCTTCKMDLQEYEFYKTHSGDIFPVCKKCLAHNLNPYDFSQVLQILKDLDYPFIIVEWIQLAEKYPNNPIGILGRYLAKMKLRGWKNFTYQDTYRLNKDIKWYFLTEPRLSDIIVWKYPMQEYDYDNLIELHKSFQSTFPHNTVIGLPKDLSLDYYNKDDMIEIAKSILREVGQS